MAFCFLEVGIFTWSTTSTSLLLRYSYMSFTDLKFPNSWKLTRKPSINGFPPNVFHVLCWCCVLVLMFWCLSYRFFFIFFFFGIARLLSLYALKSKHTLSFYSLLYGFYWLLKVARWQNKCTSLKWFINIYTFVDLLLLVISFCKHFSLSS